MDEVEEIVKKELKHSEFEVVASINVAQSIKKKLDEDINPYLIYGAWNPH